jgi:adenine-specific DNA methylase
MTQPKKLIEVAMPIKEISAESVRDKTIRTGHISTLHKWWARRPLPVCRAVIFASLVPDPLDDLCPQSFKDAVDLILGKKNNIGDPYKPYEDIPYTAAIDKMEDNLRNRLMMFIGKFSDKFVQNEKHGLATPVKEYLADKSLIKWECKNEEDIINKARKLIWVAHNSTSGLTLNQLIKDFDEHYEKIKNAEDELYQTYDRHISSDSVRFKEEKLRITIENFLNRMPTVFDPFAGGGAIPLEAARLGCRSYGNDINPVAHIIQKGSVEYPQLYGKPIQYSKGEFILKYGKEAFKNISNENLQFTNGEATGVNINNRLSYDVKFYAKKILELTKLKVGKYYPKDAKGDMPIAYYWAKTATCSNPSCKAEVPLLRQFYLCNKKDKKIFLEPLINGTDISFKIKKGTTDLEGWVNRGNLKCPCCGSITDVKQIKSQSITGKLKDKLIAVIFESRNGKEYRLPTTNEIEILSVISEIDDVPNEALPLEYKQAMPICGWGYTEWGHMFSKRQLFTMLSLVESLQKIKNESLSVDSSYNKAIITYLAIWIDRVSTISTQFGVYNVLQEIFSPAFGRQAIAMVFDYPEGYPFTDIGGVSYLNQLDLVLNVIDNEGPMTFFANCYNASSGEKEQFKTKYITATVTDPPYYDAIAYADLSDFFYVWLKRSLHDVFPLNFATPQTPKSEECTALKHHHNNNKDEAKIHFENKLTEIFMAIEHQTSDIISIMFAHQSTEAWTTLCNSVLHSKMNITGSWAIDTEVNYAMKADKAFLSSSVTVSCRPLLKGGYGNFRDVKKEIEKTVSKEVDELYSLGFRGADLLTACFGQAVSEFGRYQKVEKADGSEVSVAELLEMARESAFNALLKGFDGDDFTKFYIGWLQLYSFTESEFDDAAKFSRVGLSINVAELFTEYILIKNGNRQTLGTFEERIKANKNIGDRANNFLIDLVHRAMALYKGNNRTTLLQYISKVAAQPESNFWRVVTSLCEVLPAGSEDHKQALGLLTNKDSLIRESKIVQTLSPTQTKLFELE